MNKNNNKLTEPLKMKYFPDTWIQLSFVCGLIPVLDYTAIVTFWPVDNSAVRGGQPTTKLSTVILCGPNFLVS